MKRKIRKKFSKKIVITLSLAVFLIAILLLVTLWNTKATTKSVTQQPVYTVSLTPNSNPSTSNSEKVSYAKVDDKIILSANGFFYQPGERNQSTTDPNLEGVQWVNLVNVPQGMQEDNFR